MELDKTLRQGSCVWRSRQNAGSLVEGLTGTLRGAKESSSLEPEGAGIVWNCGRGI